MPGGADQKTNFSSFISPSCCMRGTRVVKCDAYSWAARALASLQVSQIIRTSLRVALSNRS